MPNFDFQNVTKIFERSNKFVSRFLNQPKSNNFPNFVRHLANNLGDGNFCGRLAISGKKSSNFCLDNLFLHDA